MKHSFIYHWTLAFGDDAGVHIMCCAVDSGAVSVHEVIYVDTLFRMYMFT